jgi:hypothetical protein
MQSEDPLNPLAEQPKRIRVVQEKPGGRLCGMSRSTLIELTERGYFRMAKIKQPGRERFIRLVHLPSLHAYLSSVAK